MANFNLKRNELVQLIELVSNRNDMLVSNKEIIDFFKAIRPKSFAKACNKLARQYNTLTLEHLSVDELLRDTSYVYDLMIKLVEKSGLGIIGKFPADDNVNISEQASTYARENNISSYEYIVIDDIVYIYNIVMGNKI